MFSKDTSNCYTIINICYNEYSLNKYFNTLIILIFVLITILLVEARIILTLSKTVTITYSPSTTKFLCFIKWALRRNIIKWTIYEIFELKQSYVEILYVSLYNRLIYICMSVLMVWIFSDYFCLSAWLLGVASPPRTRTIGIDKLHNVFNSVIIHIKNDVNKHDRVVTSTFHSIFDMF